MPLRFSQPASQRDWAETFRRLGLAALEGMALNIPNVLREFDAAAGALADPKPEERAWIWLNITLRTGLYTMATGLRPPIEITREELAPIIAEVAAAQMDALETTELTLATLWNPADQPAFAPVRDALPDFIKRISPDARDSDIDGAAKAFAAALRSASARVAALDPDFYKPLEDALSGAFGERDRRQQAWRRHEQWVRWLYERSPIFSTKREDGAPLRAVYQPLRCYWHVLKDEDETQDHQRDERRKITHVGELHPQMRAWLKDETASPLRIVTGGPGSGKSSFARAFAVEAMAQSDYRVVFIELQRMTLGADLKERIESYLSNHDSQIDPEGSKGLSGSPFEWRKTQALPILFVFDGLDELTASDSDAREKARLFIQSVHGLATSLGNASSPIRALILGRSAACQDGMAAAKLPPETMIHVAPLPPAEEWDGIRVKGGDDTVLHGAETLLTDDQRMAYWDRWARLKSIDDERPKKITSDRLKGLNAEPLLLHLLIQAEGPEDGMLENPNRVYADIFKRIHKRNQEVPGRDKLDEADFDLLTESLALAAWRGAGRTAGDAEFTKLRDTHVGARKSELAKLGAATLKGVAIQLHARQAMTGGEGYEFIHKTFSEYLTARAILRLAEWSARNIGEVGEKAVAWRWVDIVGPAEMSVAVKNFLIDEARIRGDEAHRTSLVTALTQLFDWVLASGMPAHEAGGATYRMVETTQRCAETALLSSLSALAQSFPHEGFESTGPHLIRSNLTRDLMAASRLLRRIWTGDGDPTRFGFARLDLAGAWLTSADLFGADLRGADLNGADLREANLSGADLRRADLNGADLFGADLRRADLRRANCNRLHIDSARLQFADLRETTGLTQKQVNAAHGNTATELPDHLIRPDHWADDEPFGETRGA
ncbi:MAG: pentapeptide repeat-containing protein [Pseudomonadota bacterium]